MTVLQEKTTGEARGVVRSVNEDPEKKGKGLLAMYRLYTWFAETSNAGMQAKRAALMSPAQAKNDGDVLMMVNKWYERYQQVGRMDGKHMDVKYAVPALKGILTPKLKEHIDITYGESMGKEWVSLKP